MQADRRGALLFRLELAGERLPIVNIVRAEGNRRPADCRMQNETRESLGARRLRAEGTPPRLSLRLPL